MRCTKVVTHKSESIGSLDDLIVSKDQVLFAITDAGRILGLGGHLIAVPYELLQINADGSRIVPPWATREPDQGTCRVQVSLKTTREYVT